MTDYGKDCSYYMYLSWCYVTLCYSTYYFLLTSRVDIGLPMRRPLTVPLVAHSYQSNVYMSTLPTKPSAFYSHITLNGRDLISSHTIYIPRRGALRKKNVIQSMWTGIWKFLPWYLWPIVYVLCMLVSAGNLACGIRQHPDSFPAVVVYSTCPSFLSAMVMSPFNTAQCFITHSSSRPTIL